MTNRHMTTVASPPRADSRATARRLAQLPLLAGADQDSLLAIADAGSLVTVPAGWSMIVAATPGDKAYVILEGSVEIRRQGTTPVRLGAGDVVGEKAILEGTLRSATVVAVTPLEVLHFTDDAVQRLYATVPAFREAMDATLRARALND